MAFQNPVVAGTTLIRQAIKSPNYVPNVSGWSINHDGSAEFNDLQARGGLQIGISPSPPNPYILGEVIAGTPTIAFYDGTNTTPATITAYAAGPNGGLEIYSGSPSAEEVEANWSGEALRLRYTNNGPDQQFVSESIGYLGNPIYSVASGTNDPNVNNLGFGLDETEPTPDGMSGVWYSISEIYVASTKLDDNFPCRVIDGKAPGSLTTTPIATTDTNIATANMQGVYVEDGYAYRVVVNIDFSNANVGGRMEFKLWDGLVGGTQLGGTQRRWTDNSATSTSYGGTILVFLWRQVGTVVMPNVNLSCLKSGTTAGTANVQVNSAFVCTIEKVGASSKIQGL